MTLQQFSTETLLSYLANATKTYYEAFGHNKASRNEMAVKEYKAELERRKFGYPSVKILLYKGVFNGDGSK